MVNGEWSIAAHHSPFTIDHWPFTHSLFPIQKAPIEIRAAHEKKVSIAITVMQIWERYIT
jgi:hypothetical protein